MSKHYKESHRLAWIVGYTGAIIQAFFVTRSYLRFQTTTNVLIKNPEQTELPALSICFFYKMPELRFEGYPIERSSMTLGQINASLPTWDDYVMSCEVLNGDYEFQDCLEVTTNFNQFLSLYSKCYTLFQDQHPSIIFNKNSVGSKWLINVMLNVSRIYTNNIGVYLTHSSSDLDDSLGDPSFVQFDSYNYNRASLTFERTWIKTLPWPYSTACFDYEKLTCKDRKTCINRCIANQSWLEYKAWVDRRYVKLDDEASKGHFGALSETNLTTNCMSMYPHVSCSEYMYNSIVASQIMSPFKTNDTYQINVFFPLSKFITVQYVGLQSFIEFICYVTSVISLWTEISVIRIVDKLMGFVSSKTATENLRKSFLPNESRRNLRNTVNHFAKSKLIFERNRFPWRRQNISHSPVFALKIGRKKF